MHISPAVIFSLGAVFSTVVVAAEPAFTYDRLDKNNTVLLIVDQQEGLAAAVRDWDPNVFRNNILAHAAIGQTYGLPVVMTTSVETGPNGPMPKEVIEMLPNAPIIRRPGEIDAWDSADFRAAVEATNRSQVIIAGITTDVCVTFLALSMRQAGYHVVVNSDACGTFSYDQRVGTYAVNRMQAAGVQVMNMFSISAELMRDWRNTNPDAAALVPFIDRYLASESFVIRSHAAAITNGTLVPGELGTIEFDSSTNSSNAIHSSL